ncbi:arsenic resistance protein [uncultured Oxalicibacterium sp.]|uniref:arsenic resistance protein n=1 Tax=uncultured Oxalicibacterium sp. TaxID=1168540 RepID=UPI0025F749C0|nr:arsenic resistance protein [uncultured Oxalicibacterium sp.]
MEKLRETLEQKQVLIYFGAVVLGMLVAFSVPGTMAMESAINPALAFMLFVTFLQVPLAELGKAFTQFRFMLALLVTNFIVLPVLVLSATSLFLTDPLLRLGVLLVLLAPCIDYVVTFAHLGRADPRLLLAATPLLLLVQMVMLPIYLSISLGSDAARHIEVGPFLHAFIWLIAIPLALAAIMQGMAKRHACWNKASTILGLAPVPATALVLLIVILAVAPQLAQAQHAVVTVLPFYLAYAVFAPLCGWWVAKKMRLDAPASRAIAFSAGTRNSLVVLPLALAIPGAIPILPAIIVTQTLIELLFELLYVRLIASWGKTDTV